MLLAVPIPILILILVARSVPRGVGDDDVDLPHLVSDLPPAHRGELRLGYAVHGPERAARAFAEPRVFRVFVDSLLQGRVPPAMDEDQPAPRGPGDGAGRGTDAAAVQGVRVDVRAVAEHQHGVLRGVPGTQDALVVGDDVGVGVDSGGGGRRYGGAGRSSPSFSPREPRHRGWNGRGGRERGCHGSERFSLAPGARATGTVL